MWLVMRGALSRKVKKLHQAYYLPSMTPIATVIFEDDSDDPLEESVADYRTPNRQAVGGHRKARRAPIPSRSIAV